MSDTNTLQPDRLGDEEHEEDQPASRAIKAPKRGSGRRRVLTLTALALLVAGNGTFAGWVYHQHQGIEAELAALRDAHAGEVGRIDHLVGDVKGNDVRTSLAESRITVLEGDEAGAKAKAFDVNAVVSAVKNSVVTVHCGNSLGSGFAIYAQPASGYQSVIMTNSHVVKDCVFSDGPKVSVTQGSTTMSSKLWNWDEKNDLAVIMVQPILTPLAAANPAAVGDPVLAIGSPFGMEGTVTTGIVSGVKDNWYQTSALINHGNSGGPLIDRQGHILGVNTIDFGGGGTGVGAAVRLKQACVSILTEGCPYAN